MDPEMEFSEIHCPQTQLRLIVLLRRLGRPIASAGEVLVLLIRRRSERQGAPESCHLD